MRHNIILILLSATFLLTNTVGCHKGTGPSHGLYRKKAMVVTAHPLASKVGNNILRQGGNAIDAAIAVQFALAVVYPVAGNIGGGGFMVCRMNTGESYTLDFREKAPIQASEDMYLDKIGEVIDKLSTESHLACGVPGTVDGMVMAYEKFGTIPWEILIQPAIDLAENGFPITGQQAENLNASQQNFRNLNTVRSSHLLKSSWNRGDTLRQHDLAATLRRIGNDSRDGFYKGRTAELILAEMKRGGGIISAEDLNNYRSVWREPVRTDYKDYTIISMGPPSSGGIALIQLLQMISSYEVNKWGWQSAKFLHLVIEAEKRVYADRSVYLGDEDFYDVPVSQLLDPDYNHRRMAGFRQDKATPADSISEGKITFIESGETTHFSIVDPFGNAVALTTTLNGAFGSKIMVGNAGFFLNNEMDDFSVKPGYPNMFGLTGGEANAIAPGKRMLSSMTPTIVEKNDSLFMVTGTPGGATIITSVFQSILNVIEFHMTMQESVNAPRFHNQWKPDQTRYEPGRINKYALRDLIKMGHQFKEVNSIGQVNAILILPNGMIEGAADPRGDNAAEGF